MTSFRSIPRIRIDSTYPDLSARTACSYFSGSLMAIDGAMVAHHFPSSRALFLPLCSCKELRRHVSKHRERKARVENFGPLATQPGFGAFIAFSHRKSASTWWHPPRIGCRKHSSTCADKTHKSSRCALLHSRTNAFPTTSRALKLTTCSSCFLVDASSRSSKAEVSQWANPRQMP